MLECQPDLSFYPAPAGVKTGLRAAEIAGCDAQDFVPSLYVYGSYKTVLHRHCAAGSGAGGGYGITSRQAPLSGPHDSTATPDPVQGMIGPDILCRATAMPYEVPDVPRAGPWQRNVAFPAWTVNIWEAVDGRPAWWATHSDPDTGDTAGTTSRHVVGNI